VVAAEERPLNALDAGAIAAALAPATRARLREVEVVTATDSTNGELMRRGVPALALLAETQSAGRGRRGKAWASPPAANLYLSLSWSVRRPAGLSLAMGLACAEALRDARVRVKWPNDLVAEGRKLGGLLIELAGNIAVIGVGLNVRMPPQTAIDQPWIDLAQLGVAASRNELAAYLLDALVAALVEFEAHGLAAFESRWRAFDALAGREVRVLGGEQVWQGSAAGIASDGGLRVLIDGRERVFHSAEVSVRDASVVPAQAGTQARVPAFPPHLDSRKRAGDGAP
jgi:BirA family biotin operon repressor/biotin-[acetyl-CoA-carboxylase] ligase